MSRNDFINVDGTVNWDNITSQFDSKYGINVMYPPKPLAGAKGNGTTDDTVAIQAVINYASQNNIGMVYVPQGQYKITSSIILKDNVSIIGAGDNITIFLNNTLAECFKYIGILEAPRIGTIYSNFCIQGGAGTSEIGIHMKNACGYKIVKVQIIGQYIGLKLAYGNRIAVEDCTISNCTYRGILLGADTGGIAQTPYLDGLIVMNCGFTENLYDIEHTGSGSTATATIVGNYFYGYVSTITCIWISNTKGIQISGNWFELGTTQKGIVTNVVGINGTTYGTPYGTVISSNCFASHGTIFIDIIEGSATVIEGNSFTSPSVGCIHIGTGAGRTQVGVNKYENLGAAYTVSASYMNLLDTPDRSLIVGRILQQKGGTVALTADGTNSYAQVTFENAPADWTKVSCILTWNSPTVTSYTDPPTQISWSKADSITIRIEVAGKTSGNISYLISESN